ncbi:translation initiation factor IF-1 [Patescibacteria group bacterium]|nr:translation initiation factor IF-1 [Patescibacteria group bacterium]
MLKKQKLIDAGIISETLPDGHFKVKLDSDEEITAYISGKMRIYRIRILTGDRVRVERSSYDLKRGRIVYRS